MAVKMVCTRCGSEAVKADAWAQWDDENQMWEIAGFVSTETAYCDDCDGPTSMESREIARFEYDPEPPCGPTSIGQNIGRAIAEGGAS